MLITQTLFLQCLLRIYFSYQSSKIRKFRFINIKTNQNLRFESLQKCAIKLDIFYFDIFQVISLCLLQKLERNFIDKKTFKHHNFALKADFIYQQQIVQETDSGINDLSSVRKSISGESNRFAQLQQQKNNGFLMSQNQILNKNMMYDSQNTPQQNKKTFVFQNELTSQSTISYHRINTESAFTNLKPMFDFYCPMQKNKIQLFNTFTSRFSPLQKINPQSPALIPNQYLEYGFIMIRYKNIRVKEQEYYNSQSIEEISELSTNKKDRSKERTIGEVIQLVKRWRKLHEGNQDKKLNLQEAAKVVGVSKKSLDDYYYQLRIGEQYEYEFAQHLNDKIGDLRGFVKSRKPQKMQKHRNSKHPKKLKIIQELIQGEQPQLEMQPQKDNNNNIAPYQTPILRNLYNQNDPFCSESASLFMGKDLEEIQNNYYDNFQNIFDPDEDPYFYTGDFKKKQSYNIGQDSDILF